MAAATYANELSESDVVTRLYSLLFSPFSMAQWRQHEELEEEKEEDGDQQQQQQQEDGRW